ncbi:Erg28 like protein-domain-containing protein [Pyronema domesticum]|uniref:Similar to Ergosterol biosynthetic protein 28 acc. no. P40030 n=1 Tax=Pyronema omphalodes (strain CBS 100304) TaxID=1076935 RepID=U4L7L0_PYROM|nr:Erg28 like protein-domain-containing protein [Pyronema domesticum]CCX12614.1 Similar to Ergosterol biosynthetic protein 28; acc. no. P40030 [Pyronema omphalodes CBS 100304]
MDAITAYLPQAEGYLPKWLLFVSAVAMFNSIQNYTTIALTQRVYSKRPQDVNTLSSRTFGTWTFLSAIVRCYAAYNIANQGVYDICIWSYLIAGAHFVSEWLIFGTASLGAGLTGPLVVSSSSLIWMLTQREFYTGA